MPEEAVEIEIRLIPITKDYFPPAEGKYLVRTVSATSYGRKFGKPELLLATVSFVEVKNELEYRIDVNNQTPTHISNKPIR